MSESIITSLKDTGVNLATKIALKINKQLTETYLKIYVCNNGNDDNPTWEDCTNKVNNQYHVFTNNTKTAPNGAIMIKMEIDYSKTFNINKETEIDYTFTANYIIVGNDGMTMYDKIELKDFTRESSLGLWNECILAISSDYESVAGEVVII